MPTPNYLGELTVSRASIPWRAWYGDESLDLSFPSSWYVRTCPPRDGPDIGEWGIEAAFDNPIGTPTIEELVRGKSQIAIAVDDVSRTTPAGRLFPHLLRRLVRGGVEMDRIRVLLAVGTHRAMAQQDVVKKIGAYAADQLEVVNHVPYDNIVHLGTSDRGTPVWINRLFVDSEVRIGIGSIVPHGSAGFSGGAKVVIPGLAGIETVASIHAPERLKTGLLEIEHNEFRADIEQMVGEWARLDWIINVVPNSRREVAGLVVGDMIDAHRAGVEISKRICATELPLEPVDIAICNAYPKDTDFHQVPHALHVLQTSPTPVVRPGGTIVVISASPEGLGYHGLYGVGMRYDLTRKSDTHHKIEELGAASVLFYVPGLSAVEARRNGALRSWNDVLDTLLERHSDRASVAVFPCGPIQLAQGSAVVSNRSELALRFSLE